MTFDEWEDEQGYGLCSSDAYFAGKAWNAALNEAIRIIKELETKEYTFYAGVIEEIEELKS
jgi:hypothetical protein